MSCAARQYSDQMVCNKCGLAWDMNDPEPPQCKPEQEPLLFANLRTERPPIRVTFDDHVYSPEPGVLITSVHYETDPKTGKRRVIIGFN